MLITKEISEQEFEEIQKSCLHPQDGNFLQSNFWANFMSKRGWNVHRFGGYNGQNPLYAVIVLQCKFSANKNYFYIPHGPIFQETVTPEEREILFSQLLSAIDKIVIKHGSNITSHLRIEPRYEINPSFLNNFHKATYNFEPRDTLLIDLKMDEEKILAQMKPKGRYNIKIAQRSEVIVSEDITPAGLNRFLNLYKETSKRDHFEAKKDSYFQTLFDSMAQNACGKVYFASSNGIDLATAIVLLYGDRSTYFYGASSAQEREKMAPYLLHWQIIKDMKKLDFKYYDFWGIKPLKAGSGHPWHGITEFKLKFGGIKKSFIGAYDYVYDPIKYSEYQIESGEKIIRNDKPGSTCK